MRRIGAAGAAVVLPLGAARAQTPERTLAARPAGVKMVGAEHPATGVWTYEGDVPGPELRFRQGERLRVSLLNRLEAPTTVHWHGIRLPNAMDGVPHVTQDPIAPGGRFLYEFDLPDAGTYWYHPHAQSHRQVGRGLSGALVVEEAEPPSVDRDLVWLLSDWRLDQEAQLVEDFGNLHDVTHAGRLGNTVTINGRLADRFEVSPGERVRLRLINAANARIYGLEFRGHEPTVIALDGQPVAPHRPPEGRVVVAPGQRTDLILDCTGAPGTRAEVIDAYYARAAYRLLDLVYGETRVRSEALPPVAPLPRNPVALPDLAGARRHEIVLGGGMMGRMAEARVDGRLIPMQEMIAEGLAWALNGISAGEAHEHAHEPLFAARPDESVLIGLMNDTAWPHPMHFHGHLFRLMTRNGRPPEREEWRDTVLLEAGDRLEIAFRADNPGDWMVHCHILEHQAGGMMGLFRVG